MMGLRPGSPQGNAPGVPAESDDDDDVEASIGGNMALGSSKRSKRSRGSTRSVRRGGRGSTRSVASSAAVGAGDEGDEEDEEDASGRLPFPGRNAIPDDVAE